MGVGSTCFVLRDNGDENPENILPGGVMVTHENLDLVFMVRIHAGQR
jgi:hypothetical protein